MSALNGVPSHNCTTTYMADEVKVLRNAILKAEIDYSILALALTWCQDDFVVLDMALAYVNKASEPQSNTSEMDRIYYQWAIEDVIHIRGLRRLTTPDGLDAVCTRAENVALRFGLELDNLKLMLIGAIIRRQEVMLDPKLTGPGPAGEWAPESLHGRLHVSKGSGLPFLN